MALETSSLVLQPVTMYLFGKLKRQVQYFTKHQAYLSAFQKEFNQLLERTEDVVKLVEKAKRELKEPSKQVSEWLEKVQRVENEWVTLSKGMNTRNWCFKGLCPNLFSRRKMSKRILEMITEVEELHKSGDFTMVAHDPPPLDVIPLGPSDTVKKLISRELIMEDIMEALQEESIRSIGVYGMGGIGKTTLMKRINDEFLVTDYFKKVILVTVSHDPDMKILQASIAERLGLELKEHDLATRANALYERLKKEKSVLIIFDDMWNMIDVGELGLRQGTEGMHCKFILTTRNANVCKRMKVQKTVEIGLLSENESWILFEEKAGPIVGLPRFKRIAPEIVRKCKGAPLAIATLGSTLGVEEDEFVWERALSALQNPSAMGLNDIMPEVVTSLAWSYDRLPNPEVQLCFLYCCLFPEDHNISMTDMRNYGIGEKFLKMTKTLGEALAELLCHVKILKECGLLLDGDYNESVKMHDVVRDVAIFIADKDNHGFLVNVDGGSRYMPESDKLNTYKRISLMRNEDEVLSGPLECPELRSLMIGGTNHLSLEQNNFFEGTTKISVLDIRAEPDSYGVKVLRMSESVSQLKNIQTLYLQNCDLFNKISVLAGLTKIQVLSMRGSKVGELPEDIGNLTNLRFLDLSSAITDYVAPNVFSKLTRIEELYMSDGFDKWGKANGDGIRKNAGFTEVASLPRLSVLEVNTWDVKECHPDWLKNLKQFRISVNKYHGWSEPKNLVTFDTENMGEHLWISNITSNRDLVVILSACYGFKSVTELAALEGKNCLNTLRLVGCYELENVIVANESDDFFGSLKMLLLENLRLGKILDGVTRSMKCLGQLNYIEVTRCHELGTIFPSNLLFPKRRLQNLRGVTIKTSDAVQYVFSTEENETPISIQPVTESTDTGLLSAVTHIILFNLPKLKSIWNGVVPFGSLQGLTVLDVRYCHCLEYLLSSDMAVSVCNISSILVRDCGTMEKIIKSMHSESLNILPPPPIFQNLYDLTIDSCPKIKILFSFGVARHLNQLNRLSVVHCPRLRKIIENGEEEPEEHNSLLPALQDLQLGELWSLTSFSNGDAHMNRPLKKIEVLQCPNLTLKGFPLLTLSSSILFEGDDALFRRLVEENESQVSIVRHSSQQDETEFEPLYSAVSGLWSADRALQLEGANQLGKIFSDYNWKFRKVAESAIIPRSIEFLMREDFPQLQSETAWMLASIITDSSYRQIANIHGIEPILVKLCASPHEDIRGKAALAAGIIIDFRTSEYIDAGIEHLVIPILVKLLSSHNEDIRAKAALALGNIPLSTECRDLVLRHGGLVPLLAQLNDRAAVSTLSNATWTLFQIFTVEPFLPFEQMKIALPALKSLVYSNDETVCINVCGALAIITTDTAEGIQAVIETGIVPRLVELLQHSSPNVVIKALIIVHDILRGDNVQIQCIINHQALPCLLSLLTRHFMPEIKVLAAGAINNISSCRTEEVIKYLVDQGCIKPFCDLLDSFYSDLVAACLLGLKDIIGVGGANEARAVNIYVQHVHDCGGLKKIVNLLRHDDNEVQYSATAITAIVVAKSPECRDLIIGHGALIPLLSHLNDQAEASRVRSSIQAIKRFFHFEPYPSFDQMSPALLDLKRLTHSSDEAVCTSACSVLACLCEGGAIDEFQDLFDPSVWPKLVELLQHPSPSIVLDAIVAVANILKGRKDQSQCFIDHQALPCLSDLLTQDHAEAIKLGACNAVANIICAGEEQVKAVIDGNIIGPLVHLLETAGLLAIKTVAAVGIKLATGYQTREVIQHVVDKGCIKPICALLDCPDSSLVLTCLQGLDNIIYVGGSTEAGVKRMYARLVHQCGGLKKIVNLLSYNDTEIQELAAVIIGNVACESSECRDLVLGHGALIPLLSHLNDHAEVSLLRSSMRAVASIFNFEPYPSFEQMKPALPDLKRLIHSDDEDVCSYACSVFACLCESDTINQIQDLFDPSVCPKLVELLQHPSPWVVLDVIAAVANILKGGKVQSQCFIDHQILPCLLDLLTQYQMETIKQGACAAIANIIRAGEEHVQAVIDSNIIGPLVHQLQTAGLAVKTAAAQAIKFAAEYQNPEVIQYFVNQGCIKPFCDLLDCSDSSIVLTCLQGLHNILSVELAAEAGARNEYVQLVQDSGGLQKIANLLSHNEAPIQDLAAIITGTVAGESPEFRDLVLGLGVLTPLLSHLNDQSEASTLRKCTQAVLSFYFFKPYPSFDQMKSALPVLQRLILSKDENVCSSVCWVLACLCEEATDEIHDSFDPAIYPRLVELLQHPSPSVVSAAISAVDSIVQGGKVQSQYMIDHQVLPCLFNLLTNDFMENIKQGACRSVANIMDAGDEQVQAVIDANLIGALVHQLEIFESCKGAVACAIINATETGNKDHIKYIVNQGCIKQLCDLLDCLNSSTIAFCLIALENILKAGETGETRDLGGVNSYAKLIDESGGFKKIIKLQGHDDTDIREKAANIVKTYLLETEPSSPSDTPAAGFPVASGILGIATSSSYLQRDAPLKFIEDLEEESGKEADGLVGSSRLEDDLIPTDCFGFKKNEFPILYDISDSASTSSFDSKPPQKHFLNTNVEKNSQNKGMETSSIFHNLTAKSFQGVDDEAMKDHTKDQAQPHKQEGKYFEELQQSETSKMNAKASRTRQESSSATSITECMKILDGMDIKIEERTYYRAIKLLREEEWREAFMYMSDARRIGWLRSIEAGEM